jgi:hypothetical protein
LENNRKVLIGKYNIFAARLAYLIIQDISWRPTSLKTEESCNIPSPNEAKYANMDKGLTLHYG